MPTARWDDIERDDHDTAFMVAGAQKADLLADLAASVDRAIVEGKSLEAFRKDFNAAVERHDWHGWTGEDAKGGRAWRTRTIYRTNASVSYAAGRLAQLKEGNFTWVYRHGGSVEPRPEHLSWDGVALPPTIRSGRRTIPERLGLQLLCGGCAHGRRRPSSGGDPDKKLPDNWKALDPRTGAPIGIGKGWDYAPGASVAPIVQAAAEKMRHWDYAIGKAFYADLPPASRDAIAEAYRRLPSVADDARRYARRVLGDSGEAVIQPNWTLGGVTSVQGDAVEQLTGKSVAGFDFSLAPSDVLHVQRRHGEGNERDGQQVGVTADDYALLTVILSSPDAVEDAGTSDVGEPLVRYSKAIDGLRYVAVMAVRNKRRTLALKTFYIRREA